MPLSEHEQRLLEEMERSLYQNDADFVAKVGGKRARPAYRSIVLGILLAVVGVIVLVLGVWFQQPLVGILGFVVMFAGVLVAIAPGKRVAVEPGAAEPKRAKARGGQTGFMNRMNDRWDKRNDGGGEG
ncbi:DUF3040 domain-containing protein [Leifsonia poae]|uniref:DUF3040 domain-containing protein n=1 Tax=Leifsonia poae TaxID=110933 RepID=UPI003D68CFF2